MENIVRDGPVPPNHSQPPPIRNSSCTHLRDASPPVNPIPSRRPAGLPDGQLASGSTRRRLNSPQAQLAGDLTPNVRTAIRNRLACSQPGDAPRNLTPAPPPRPPQPALNIASCVKSPNHPAARAVRPKRALPNHAQAIDLQLETGLGHTPIARKGAFPRKSAPRSNPPLPPPWNPGNARSPSGEWPACPTFPRPSRASFP